MALNVRTIGPDAPLEGLIALFGREKFRRVPVVDEERRVIGIVTLCDLAKVPYPERTEVDEALHTVVSAS